jgi:UDP-N-acetylglucosamine:LPS N-acetylglucosamine transferase
MASLKGEKVTILCSGFGLGFYIPGLLIADSLRESSIETDVEVFESFMARDKLDMVERNRDAYHRSFQVALTSQKIPSDIRKSLDLGAVQGLLSRWKNEDRRHFVSLSGHWVHILDTYRESRAGNAILVDLLYVDADLSPSWRWLAKLNRHYASPYREVRLYGTDEAQIMQTIGANCGPPLPFTQRQKRLVVHGGGWGIGTFQQRIPQLEAAGYQLDIACYQQQELTHQANGRRYFMDDPSWRTWHRDAHGEYTYPPFSEATPPRVPNFVSQQRCHGIHRVIRESRAIVSKPGAGTLIDSFASATPLVMLEPFGPHEEQNARVWETAGLGIPFSRWSQAGYPVDVLEDLHINLLARRESVPDYAECYIQRGI